MKMIVAVALALVAVTVAVPVEEKKVEVVSQTFERKPNGEYVHRVSKSDGSETEEVGELKEVIGEDNKPVLVLTVRGFYAYVDSEGNPEKIVYRADETGYHAEGPSVPVIPETSA